MGFLFEFHGKSIGQVDNKTPLFCIAGPCAIEGRSQALEVASALKEIFSKASMPFVYKSSFDKANRSSSSSFRGVGMAEGLSILAEVREKVGVPVLTDVHLPGQAEPVAEVVDMLQIPAFLCRQTDLIEAVAATGKPVNIKKGQFLSPQAMHFAAEKVVEAGDTDVMLTERGTTFGYQDLVVDYRGIPEMQAYGYPVILDATHSLQQPNQAGGVTGGMPRLIETIARAGIAAGADGLFIETHENPAVAKSDGANMLPLDQLEGLLERLVRIRRAITEP